MSPGGRIRDPRNVTRATPVGPCFQGSWGVRRPFAGASGASVPNGCQNIRLSSWLNALPGDRHGPSNRRHAPGLQRGRAAGQEALRGRGPGSGPRGQARTDLGARLLQGRETGRRREGTGPSFGRSGRAGAAWWGASLPRRRGTGRRPRPRHHAARPGRPHHDGRPGGRARPPGARPAAARGRMETPTGTCPTTRPCSTRGCSTPPASTSCTSSPSARLLSPAPSWSRAADSAN